MVVGATTAARGGAASRLAAADAAALSVSLSPFLPSSVEEEPASRADADGAAAPPATVGRKRTVRFEPEAAAFQPTHAVFTPKLSETGELRYRKPDDRVSSLAPPDAARSTLAQPNYDDFLRRVSVVLYQHLRRCEKRHREQQRVAKGQLLPPTAAAFHSSLDGHGPLTESRAPAPTEEDEDDDEMLLHPASEDSNAPTAMTTRSGSSASLAVDLPVDEVFREEHFVTPQYKYTFLRLPRVHPLTAFAMQKVSSRRHVPSVDEIFRFCKHLFNQAQLSAECSIVCLIYIERLMEQAGVPLLVASWKPIVLCGLLLASKVQLVHVSRSHDKTSRLPRRVGRCGRT